MSIRICKSILPGMTELNSTIILAAAGVDVNIFDDTKLFCSWCDLANNESAGKKKSVRSEKAGPDRLHQTSDGAMRPCHNQKQEAAILCYQIWAYQKAARTQENNYCHCQNDGLYLSYGF